MASTLNKLTGMGGDVRKIAALLQKKAPPGHRLAYINDEEAALLKARGGSGKPHADTGIPSFEVDYSYAPDESAAETSRLQGAEDRIQATRYSPDTATQEDISFGPGTAERVLYDPRTGQAMPTVYRPDGTSGPTFFKESGGYQGLRAPSIYDAPSASQFGVQPFGTSASQLSGGAGAGLAVSPSALTTDISIPESPKFGLTSGQSIAGVTGTAAEKEEGLADQLSRSTGLRKDTLANLGLAGALGYLGSRQAKKAQEAGQAGAAQMRALAAPYQQAGTDIQAKAQRGELTPQAQQSLQAVQAQAAQSAERRGGVGQAQMQAQVEAFRQQLLSQQYDYGLKLSGIGDNIALGAIRTGLQADQYVNQLTSNYYSNIARTAYGIAPQVAGTTAAG